MTGIELRMAEIKFGVTGFGFGVRGIIEEDRIDFWRAGRARAIAGRRRNSLRLAQHMLHRRPPEMTRRENKSVR